MALTTKTRTNTGGALIGYNNLLTSASIASGTAQTNGEVDRAIIPNTYERYKPSSGVNISKYQMSANADINFVGIAAHTLSGETVTISYATTVSGTSIELAVITPTDNEPIMITFDDTDAREIIISINTTAGAEIGVVYAGLALEMPRSIYGGHAPITLQARTEYQSNMSESGQFLGRNIVRQGLQTNYNWTYLDPAFIRGEFSTFVQSARRYPFFIKWRPDKFDEVAFGYTTRDVRITNMGGAHGLMSAQMTLKAHSDVV